MKLLRLPPVRVGALTTVLAAVLISGSARLGAIDAPTMNPATVLGPNVTLSWSAVAGASSYKVAAGLTPGGEVFSQNVGNVSTVSVAAPLGTYFVRVYAIDANGESPASNEISLSVTSLFVPPAAPTNLTAYLNGTAALITWDLGAGGGAPTSLVLHAGTSPGSSDVGVFPVAVGTQLAVSGVAANTYFLRVAAVNQAGQSPASNEFQLVMPAGGGCSAPPARAFTAAAFGRYLQFRWDPVPGSNGYRLDFSELPGGPVTLSQGIGATASGWNVSGAPLGVYYGRLSTTFSCGSQATGPEVTITIDGAPPPGPRTPNPAPGQRLPLPNGASVVGQVAAERRDLLLQSCREHGGNNRFMFEVVRRLRAIDNRWGLNWKRGNRGDLSQDIVNYNYGSDSDEDTTNVYIIDIIGGHCGSNPGPAWIDQTQATIDGGTIGRWTLLPYLDAGYPIVSDEPQP